MWIYVCFSPFISPYHHNHRVRWWCWPLCLGALQHHFDHRLKVMTLALRHKGRCNTGRLVQLLFGAPLTCQRFELQEAVLPEYYHYEMSGINSIMTFKPLPCSPSIGDGDRTYSLRSNLLDGACILWSTYRMGLSSSRAALGIMESLMMHNQWEWQRVAVVNL